MIDAWVKVDPRKLSPEAPVIVADFQGVTYSPGGAGNAAVNCAHLGAETYVVGLVGKGLGNEYGTSELRAALKDSGVNTDWIVGCCEWPTIEKRRFVDGLGRHLLRVDREQVCSKLDIRDVRTLTDTLISVLSKDGLTSCLVSDYGKGTCDPDIMPTLLEVCQTKKIFTVVNGKPDRLSNYRSATVLVLNREEALAALQVVSPDPEDRKVTATGMLAEVLGGYLGGRGIKNLVVTDGANGLYWHSKAVNGPSRKHIPAVKVDVADVAGAGDTICATLARYGEISAPVLEQAVENAAKVVSQRGTSVPV